MKIIKNILIIALSFIFFVSCGEEGEYHTGGGDFGNYDDETGGRSVLRIINSSGSTASICNVYSSDSSSNWGSDRLTGTISPGSSRDFSTNNCDRNYDLLVVFCDGWRAEKNYYRRCGTVYEFIARNW